MYSWDSIIKKGNTFEFYFQICKMFEQCTGSCETCAIWLKRIFFASRMVYVDEDNLEEKRGGG